MDGDLMVKESSTLDPLTCPHCQAGRDGIVLGLFWDSCEEAWRCVLCGHRSFEEEKLTDAQRREEMLWDRILEAYDAEEKGETEDTEEMLSEEKIPSQVLPLSI